MKNNNNNDFYFYFSIYLSYNQIFGISHLCIFNLEIMPRSRPKPSTSLISEDILKQ